MRPRFTIARLVAFIAACGVGFAALRSGSGPWASVLYSAALAATVLGLINAGCGRGRVRAFWAGFTLVIGAYLTAAFGPWCRENVAPRLVTTALLQALYARITPAEASKNVAGVIWLPNGGQGATQWITTGSPNLPPNPTWQELVVQGSFATTGPPSAPEATESFRAIGHSLWALLLAVLGGVWARHRHLAARADAPESRTP